MAHAGPTDGLGAHAQGQLPLGGANGEPQGGIRATQAAPTDGIGASRNLLGGANGRANGANREAELQGRIRLGPV